MHEEGFFGIPEAGLRQSATPGVSGAGRGAGKSCQGDSAAVGHPGNTGPTPTPRARPHASRLGAHASWASHAAKQDFCAGVIDHKRRRSFRLSSDALDRGM